MFRTLISCTAILLGALSAAAALETARADPSTAARDCAAILLQDLEDASLTRAERIALLEKALLDSLNCSATVGAGAGASSGATTGSTASGGVQGSEGAEPGAQTEVASVVESAPAGDVQGDLPADQAPLSTPTASTQHTADTDNNPTAATQPNGKPPEDIPPAANDDIIAKQFRQAALDETDPVARAKLWNEYRRYKNLPVQDVPES